MKKNIPARIAVCCLILTIGPWLGLGLTGVCMAILPQFYDAAAHVMVLLLIYLRFAVWVVLAVGLVTALAAAVLRLRDRSPWGRCLILALFFGIYLAALVLQR